MRFTSGHIFDLVSNDVQRLESDTFILFFDGVRGLIELFIVTVLLFSLIGWQTIVGIVSLCMVLPCYVGFSYVGAVLRLRTAMVSDCRITLINQVVSGIRAIKTNAWEDKCGEKIKSTRR